MSYSLELVLPDIDWSVHNSPDQSESKNTEKGLTFTGAVILHTSCKNMLSKICNRESVISVIKNEGIATFDLNVHFRWSFMWDSVTMHRMKQNRNV